MKTKQFHVMQHVVLEERTLAKKKTPPLVTKHASAG